MRCPFWFLLVVTLYSTPVIAEEKTETVELGGSRKVQATITTTDRFYIVELSMRGMRAFDDATNEEINQELAREYAIRALARQLSKSEDVQFTLGAERTLESGLKGDRYRLVVRWPKNQVRLLSSDTATPKSEKNTRTITKPAFQGKLFTAKEDHLNTLRCLQEINNRALKLVGEKAQHAVKKDQRKTLIKGIAALEERGLQAFDQLANTIKDDENLIDLTERPELLTVLELERKLFLDRLRETLAEAEPPPVTEKFTKVEIIKPFDTYLRKNPLLMDLAGAIIIELGPDRMVIIGIAKTILRDESPEELLRAEKVCPIKAKAAIVAERDGSRITYLKQVKDTIEIVKDAEGEKVTSVSERTKITEERIQGMVKGMPVVGRWRSENGKIFYLAVGTLVNAKGEPVKE